MSKEERITQLEEDIELLIQCNKDLMDQMSGHIRREAELERRLDTIEEKLSIKGKKA